LDRRTGEKEEKKDTYVSSPETMNIKVNQ